MELKLFKLHMPTKKNNKSVASASHIKTAQILGHLCAQAGAYALLCVCVCMHVSMCIACMCTYVHNLCM